MNTFDLVVLIVGVALVFDYINGFHDAANSIATVVSTKVLTPGVAVIWAAVFNFLAAYLLGTGVAATVGGGFVNVHLITPWVLLAGHSQTDRKSTRLNSSHMSISYAVFCLKKKI